MKCRSWVAVFLLTLFGFLFQAGCGGAPELPSEPTGDTTDPGADVEVPPP